MLWALEAVLATILLATGSLFAKKLNLMSPSMKAPAFLAGLFIVMGLGQIPYLLFTRQAFLPPLGLLWLAVLAGLASFGANIFGFTAVLRASNVGYPYAIWQVLPVLLMVVGLLFFNQAVTAVQAAGVLLAIAGAILVALAQTSEGKKGRPWVHLTIGWLLLGGLMISLNTELARRGVSPATTLFVIFWVAGLLYLFGLRQDRVLRRQSSSVLWLLVAAGLIAALANDLAFFAYAHAPNQGFAGALQASLPFLVALGGKFLLKQPISWKGYAGFALSVAGGALLVLGKGA